MVALARLGLAVLSIVAPPCAGLSRKTTLSSIAAVAILLGRISLDDSWADDSVNHEHPDRT